MRICRTAAAMADNFSAVSRLAQANFGQADVYLERYIENARHIEVQIFGDGCGNVIAVGERDCSAQRRNQKVIEEAPAVGISPATRKELWRMAENLARSLSYRSAGTVEFIVDPRDGAFYFLEVNTRIQVEHGVTEEVTGVDIVEWMVRIAAGEPMAGSAPVARGAAIQARI